MVRSRLNAFSVYQTDNLYSYLGNKRITISSNNKQMNKYVEMGYYWVNGNLCKHVRLTHLENTLELEHRR